MQISGIKMIKRSYTAVQKLKIINECKGKSVAVVSNLFKIHLTMIYRWIKDQDKLARVNNNVRKIGSGRRPAHPEQEEQVYGIIKRKRKEGFPLMWKDVNEIMLSLTRQDSKFKASWGWIVGFKRRFNLTLKCPTLRIAASKWKEYEEGDVKVNASIQSFKRQVNQLIASKQYDPEDIINMDETPTWIDSPIKKVVDFKGSSQVPIKNVDAGSRKSITTILTVTKSGKMLDPCVIVPGQSKLARELAGATRQTRSDGLTTYKQANKTMNESIMLDWIEIGWLHNLILASANCWLWIPFLLIKPRQSAIFSKDTISTLP